MPTTAAFRTSEARQTAGPRSGEPRADASLKHLLQHVDGLGGQVDSQLSGLRRDLQGEMKKQGRPWCIGKAFDHSSPIGAITPAEHAGDIENAEIWLQVNGKDRQRSAVSKLIWNIGEIIEHVSTAWELAPGDLIYTGTPEGVAAVVAGDTLVGGVKGLEQISVTIKAA